MTPRARQIHDLIARGFLSREIAVELGMSFSAVENARSKIHREIGPGAHDNLRLQHFVAFQDRGLKQTLRGCCRPKVKP